MLPGTQANRQQMGAEVLGEVPSGSWSRARAAPVQTGGGVPVDSHLGTVDVIDLDGSGLVVYSTEVTPDQVADTLGPAIEEGHRGLKEYCES